jgi:hypothetical protein
MKIHTHDAAGEPILQGTQAWRALHLGIPTASEAHRIATSKYKKSASQRPFMARLLAERVTRQLLSDEITTEHMEYGKANEDLAARKFTFETGVELQTVAFVTTDDGRWGCSPDRFMVGRPGLLEVKCPSPQVHAEYYMDGFGSDYELQVMMQLLICEDRETAERWSWCKGWPNVHHVMRRDAPKIAALRALLVEFSDELDRHTEKLTAEGYIQERAHVLGAAELHYADPDDIEATIRSYGADNIFSG